MNGVVGRSCELCHFCSRLSKNVMRLSCSGNLLRRLHSAPLTTDNSIENMVISPARVVSTLRPRYPLEDRDENSQDSGYSADSDSQSSFRFTEPSGLAPRKSSVEPSPLKKLSSSPCGSPNVVRKSFSFSSNDSFDDGFTDLADLDKLCPDDPSDVPAGLGNLLTGQLISGLCEIPKAKQPLRRSLSMSMTENYISPASSKARVSLFDTLSPDSNSTQDLLSFKRPHHLEAPLSKRRKFNSLQAICENSPTARPKLQRSYSEAGASEMAKALHKSYAMPDLIADFSRPYALPVVTGQHEDLKSISCETLASLMAGDYTDVISRFKIIDCRYPYEYEGGHIIGAENLYTQEQVEELMKQSSITTAGDSRRNILIFHCEFSVERGPTLYRFLRRCDRKQNVYPSLQYPEVYLLHGGYKSFFGTHQGQCQPSAYQPMVDPKHESDLRKFRTKSKSWSRKPSLKRL